LARDRHDDYRRVIAALTGPESPNEILNRIVKDCTHKEEHEAEPNAVFAAIGYLRESPKEG